MIDVKGIAGTVVQAVNPDISITWQQSTGYTMDAAGKRTPTYSSTTIKAQVQAVTGETLKHIDGLNIQGVMRSIYMYGNVQGVERSDSRGGDFLVFPEIPGGSNKTWKIVTVIETWASWAHVVVVMQ